MPLDEDKWQAELKRRLGSEAKISIAEELVQRTARRALPKPPPKPKPRRYKFEDLPPALQKTALEMTGGSLRKVVVTGPSQFEIRS